MILPMPRCELGVLLLLTAVTACTSSHAAKPVASKHRPAAPPRPDWRVALRVHGDGFLQPTLPQTPNVDCSTQLCASASDPVGPLWLRGDAHLDGGCVWGVAVNGPSNRITVIWPAGTYARFGRVIRVFSSEGRLLADSARPFAGSGWAPTDEQLPSRCLVNDRAFVALDQAAPVRGS